MPNRCGCQDSCSCLVTPGTGVTVEGIGTLDRPYVVGVEQANLANSVIFSSADDTIEFTTSGVGTEAAPLRVDGAATLRMVDLIDVTDTPSSGEVPTWQADHWEFTPPPVVPPGAVNVSNGIGGVGSVGSPLRAQTSGVWGTAPLDLYGSDQTVGREVYVDSVGNLRTRPEQTVERLPSDLAALYPTGTSLFYISSANGPLWPCAGNGIVVTSKTANSAIVQQCSQFSGTSTKTWTRTGTASVWAPWVQTAGLYETAKAASANVTLSTTAETDIPGATVTVPWPGTGSAFHVTGTFDVTMLVQSSVPFLGKFSCNGVTQTTQAIWTPGTTAPVNSRLTVSQTWRVSGLAAGNVVFKLVASNSTAGLYRVAAPHTTMTIRQAA